jgi:hypothetical protein
MDISEWAINKETLLYYRNIYSKKGWNHIEVIDLSEGNNRSYDTWGEIHNWCTENCNYKYTRGTSLCFFFENVDDAMRFKLVWG